MFFIFSFCGDSYLVLKEGARVSSKCAWLKAWYTTLCYSTLILHYIMYNLLNPMTNPIWFSQVLRLRGCRGCRVRVWWEEPRKGYWHTEALMQHWAPKQRSKPVLWTCNATGFTRSKSPAANPKPYILNPPQLPSPWQSTPNPTLNPIPSSLNPETLNPNPDPETLNLEPP